MQCDEQDRICYSLGPTCLVEQLVVVRFLYSFRVR